MAMTIGKPTVLARNNIRPWVTSRLARTAQLGGHVDRCSNGCGYQAISYNSCRNRHCPKCQSLNQAKWLEQRTLRLLPTRYFHLVVTLMS